MKVDQYWISRIAGRGGSLELFAWALSHCRARDNGIILDLPLESRSLAYLKLAHEKKGWLPSPLAVKDAAEKGELGAIHWVLEATRNQKQPNAEEDARLLAEKVLTVVGDNNVLIHKIVKPFTNLR